ncbi:ABC transporter ATP-binding protein [Streptomyces omiyaensis]|nr:ABC transporter ATP-binding protein [Streptomyces omiyaensis]
MRLRGLVRRHGDVRALDGVDLDVAAGTFTAVMGPSGSGKSTLLRCAAGLERPDAGSVEVAGTALEGLSERRLTLLRRDRIGFVFQSFNLLPTLTAAQNVALPLRLAGRRPARGEVRAALARVGLAGRERHRPAELSGGQCQRVAVARALIAGPAVLFGDEPTGALDSTTGAEVMDMLRALVDEEGRTLVVVTHDPLAAARADRVVFLVDGRTADEIAAPTADGVAARLAELRPASGVAARPAKPHPADGTAPHPTAPHPAGGDTAGPAAPRPARAAAGPRGGGVPC